MAEVVYLEYGIFCIGAREGGTLSKVVLSRDQKLVEYSPQFEYVLVQGGAQIGPAAVDLEAVTDLSRDDSDAWTSTSTFTCHSTSGLAVAGLSDAPSLELESAVGDLIVRVHARGQGESEARYEQEMRAEPVDGEPVFSDEPLEHYLIEVQRA